MLRESTVPHSVQIFDELIRWLDKLFLQPLKSLDKREALKNVERTFEEGAFDP